MWRREHFPILGDREYVAGGQIGNLVEPYSWLEWNLADAAERAAEARDAEEAKERSKRSEIQDPSSREAPTE